MKSKESVNLDNGLDNLGLKTLISKISNLDFDKEENRTYEMIDSFIVIPNSIKNFDDLRKVCKTKR